MRPTISEDAEPAEQHEPGKHAIGNGGASEGEQVFANRRDIGGGRLVPAALPFGASGSGWNCAWEYGFPARWRSPESGYRGNMNGRLQVC